MRKLWILGLFCAGAIGCGGDDAPSSDADAGSDEAGDPNGGTSVGTTANGTASTTSGGTTGADTNAQEGSGQASEGDEGKPTSGDENGATTGNGDDDGASTGNGGEEGGSTGNNGGEEGGSTGNNGGEDGPNTSGNNTDPNPGDESNGRGIEISALAVPGGLDRIKIFGLDAQGGTCTVVVLVWPGNGNGGEPALPQGWSLESAVASEDVDDCGVPDPPDIAATPATTTTGSVGWAGDALPFPCEIDVDLQLDFAVLSPVDLVGDGVAVEGC